MFPPVAWLKVPVPVVVRFSSAKLIAPELSVMLPLAKVKLPTVVPVAKPEAAPVADTELAVAVPEVVKFSLSKLIAPVVEVMAAPDTVMEPAVALPVVDKFSSPKLIDPEVSVIEPSVVRRVPD